MLETFGDSNVSTEMTINHQGNYDDFLFDLDTTQDSVNYDGGEEGGIPTFSSTYTDSPSHVESSPLTVPTESSEETDFFQQYSDLMENWSPLWLGESLDTSEMPLPWLGLPSSSSCFPSVMSTESTFLPGNNTMQRTVSSSTSHLSIANYTCEHCRKTYAKRHFLNQHMKLHTKPTTCPIPQCSHRTVGNRDMDRHLLAQHPGSNEAQRLKCPRFLCPVRDCSAKKGFTRQDNLRRHLRKSHHWTPSSFH